MQFAFTPEQEMIREAAREFVAGHGSSTHLRAVLAGAQGYDPQSWQALAVELGWTGLALPENVGGGGLGAVELAILLEETGRRLFMSPLFATSGLATALLCECAAPAQQERWLRPIAAGACIATAALTGDSGRPEAIGMTLTPDGGGGGRLDGHASFVLYGDVSDLVLIAARTQGQAGDEATTLVVLPRGTAGCTAARLVTMDPTRPYARLCCAGVRVGPDAIIGGIGQAGTALARGLQIAQIAFAAEQLGGAFGALEMTVEYARQRVQFGRVIGSFQAVKHRLADLLVACEAAKSAVCYAACMVDEYRAGTATAQELAEAAALVQSCCSEAFMQCGANAIQLHGGIGFTWEHDAQLYFKRARSALTYLGTPDWHRERIARLIGLDDPPPAAAGDGR
ncbi:MAG: acyl-CoA dehydrogenase [Gammaproteobacteria bacterium]|nr:acyl-CoA dehydrogenase [Gammaproteobacteria bacterium]